MLARNWRASRAFGNGELDVVADDGRTLIFVEVKARRSLEEATSSVTPNQWARLYAAAEEFMIRTGLHGRDMRFDLVACDRWGGSVVIENASLQ